MPRDGDFDRINLMEIKRQIQMEVGFPKSEKYFDKVGRFVHGKISPLELSKLAVDILGRRNVHLHNRLLLSMLKNATLSKSPPKMSQVGASLSVRVPNGYQRNSLQSLCKDFLPSPRKLRSSNLRDRSKFRDRPSPLGPHGKTHGVEDVVSRLQEQHSATELLSLGSRPPGSEEDGEEVEQAADSPGVYSRSPVRAPLGVPVNTKLIQKRKSFGRFASPCYFDTCHSCGELPDTSSLKKRLESKLEMEGLSVSVDCVNLLNNSIEFYLKRLIKPCMELAHSRFVHTHTDHPIQYRKVPGLNGMWPVRDIQKPQTPVSASMLDFRVAMELNPLILGEDWPTQLENISLRASG